MNMRSIGNIGAKTWAISSGHIPLLSQGPEPTTTSRDELCILNTGKRAVHVEISVYYGDRAPVGPYRLSLPGERVRHVRFNDLIDPEPLPLDTPYAALIRASAPIVVQLNRRDTSQAANAISTSLAFAVAGS
jgi:hypothetical protein